MWRLFKTFFLVSVVLLLVGSVALYLGRHWLLEKSTGAILKAAERRGASDGVTVRETSFSEAYLTDLDKARWTRFSAKIALFGRPAAGGARSVHEYGVLAQTLEAELGADRRTALLRVRDATVTPTASVLPAVAFGSLPAARGVLHVERLELPVGLELAPLDPAALRASAERAGREIVAFLRTLRSERPFRFSATLEFSLGGQTLRTRLRDERSGSHTAVILDREDLRALSPSLPEELTEAEIDVIARHPLQAPSLLLLTEYAWRSALAASKRDPRLPQDAFRHLLWSYLLAKNLGPELAEELTTAHETGVTLDSEAERKMDLHNNALGRRWAAEGLAETDLLDRSLRHPEVIRRAARP